MSDSPSWPIQAPAPLEHVEPLRDSPTMSVVIAAYQAELTIAAAVESALSQTVPALEVVVCDDGSTDSTAQVLETFGDRIVVVRQENRGEAAAKNAAVAAARGDFVVVLDADDVFDRRRLEALGWLAMQRPDLDVITTDANLEIDGHVVRRAYGPQWQFETADQRGTILVRNFVLGLAAVRRGRWLAMGGFDESLTHTTDWEFWQRLVLAGARIGLVDAPLASYRLHAGSLSANRERLIDGRIAVLERARRRPELSGQERAAVGTAIRAQRRLLRLQLARDALRTGSGEIRAHSVAVAVAPGMSMRTRLKAMAAVAAPARASRRYLDRFGAAPDVGAGGWRRES